MTGRYRFRTCACGTAFRGKLERCIDLAALVEDLLRACFGGAR